MLKLMTASVSGSVGAGSAAEPATVSAAKANAVVTQPVMAAANRSFPGKPVGPGQLEGLKNMREETRARIKKGQDVKVA
jgi:hypothetical protein